MQTGTLLQQRIASQAAASCSGRSHGLTARPVLPAARQHRPLAAASRGGSRLRAEDEQRVGPLMLPGEWGSERHLSTGGERRSRKAGLAQEGAGLLVSTSGAGHLV